MICKSENLLIIVPLLDLREIGKMDVAVMAGIAGGVQLYICLAVYRRLVQWSVLYMAFLCSGGEIGLG